MTNLGVDAAVVDRDKAEKIAVRNPEFTGPLTSTQMDELGLGPKKKTETEEQYQKRLIRSDIQQKSLQKDAFKIEKQKIKDKEQPDISNTGRAFKEAKEGFIEFYEDVPRALEQALTGNINPNVPVLSERKRTAVRSIIDKAEDVRRPKTERELLLEEIQTFQQNRDKKYNVRDPNNFRTASGQNVGDGVITDWHFFPRYFPKGLEGRPIILKGLTKDDALRIADNSDNHQVRSGGYFLPFYEELDTFHRRVINARGDWKDFITIVEDYKKKDYNSILDTLKGMRDKNPDSTVGGFEDEKLKQIAAYATYLPMAGRVAYGGLSQVVQLSAGSILDAFSGDANIGTAILTDTMNAVDKVLNLENITQPVVDEKSVNKISDITLSNPAIKYVIPDENSFFTRGTDVIDVSEDSGTIPLDSKVVSRNFERQEDRDLFTKFVRNFGFNLTMVTGVLGLYRGSALKFNEELYSKAKKNLLDTKKYKNIDDIPAEELTKQAKIELGNFFQTLKTNNKSRARNWITKETALQKFSWKENPAQYWGDILKTEAAVSSFEAISQQYYTDALRDEGRTGAALAVDFMATVMGGGIGVKLQSQIVDKTLAYGLGIPLNFGDALLGSNLVTGIPWKLITDTPALAGIASIRDLASGRGTIEGLTPMQSKTLKRLGKTLNKIAIEDPAVIAKMEDSFNFMKQLYKEALDVGIPEQDLNFTMGMVFNLGPLRILEDQIIRNHKDFQADKNFKFLETAAQVKNFNDQLSESMQSMLANITTKIGSSTGNTPALNQFKDELLKITNDRKAEFQEVDDIMSSVAKLQFAELVKDDSLNASSSALIYKLQTKFPGLFVPQSKTYNLAENILDASTQAKAVNKSANLALDAFKKRSEKAKNILFKSQKTDSGEVTSPEITTVQTRADQISIINSANEVGLKIIDNQFNMNRLFASGRIEQTLKKVKNQSDTMVDAKQLLINLGNFSTQRGVKENKAALKVVGDIEFRMGEKVKEINNNFIDVMESTYEIEKKDILEEIEKFVTSSRIERGVDRKGKPDQFEIMEALSSETFQGMFDQKNIPDYNLTMRYDDVYELKSIINSAARKETTGGNVYEGMLTIVNKSLADTRSKIAMTDKKLADNLEDLDMMYKAEYADRLNQSEILRDIYGVNRVEFNSKYNENKLSKSEQSEIRSRLDLGDTSVAPTNNIDPLPYQPNKNLAKIFDRILDMDATRAEKELKAIFGVFRGEQKLVSGKSINVYDFPKEGIDENYAFFEAFNNMFDTYVATKFAKIADDSTADGKDVFEQRVAKANIKDEKAWESVYNDLEVGLLPGAQGNSEATALGEKYLALHRATNFEFGKLDHKPIQDIADHSTRITGLGKQVTAGYKKLKKDIELAVNDKIEAKQKSIQVLNVLESVNKNFAKISDSRSFYKQVLENADENGNVEFIEEGKKVWVESGKKAEDFDKIIAEHFAHGYVYSHADPSDSYRFINKKERLEDVITKGGNPHRRSELETSPGGAEVNLSEIDEKAKLKNTKEKVKGFLYDKTNGLAGRPEKTKIEIIPNLDVNGSTAMMDLESNPALFKKYLNKENLNILKVIMKLSTVSKANMGKNADLRIKSPDAGLPKLTPAGQISRINAMMQQRLGPRYYFTEASYVFMKNREAEAMVSLLLSPNEVLGPLAKMMATGRVDRADVNPAFLENLSAQFIAKTLAGFDHIYQSHKEQHDDMSDEALIVKALQRMLPQTSSNFLFPDRPEVLEDTSFAVKGVEYAGQDSERSNLRTEWDKNLLKEFRTQLDIEERRAQDESIDTGTKASKASYLDLYERALATLKQNYYPFSP